MACCATQHKVADVVHVEVATILVICTRIIGHNIVINLKIPKIFHGVQLYGNKGVIGNVIGQQLDLQQQSGYSTTKNSQGKQDENFRCIL